MRKIKKYKFFQRLSILILIAVFVLAPLRFDLATMGKAKADWTDWVDNGQEFIIEDTVWEKGEHFLDRSVVIENGATLTIKKGAKIIFQESVSGETPYLAVGDGKIIADGTSDEKIVFTSEEGSDLGFLIWFADYSLSDKVSFFRYVEINNGGKKYEEGGIFSNANSGIWNSALAWSDEGMPAIMYSSGKVHIENSTFIDNNFADIEADGYFNQENVNNFLEVVNSNFGNNENGIAVVSNIECDLDSCKDKIRLKNNWYGDENGPSGEISNGETQGASVSGELLMDGWRKNSLIADPVVIVPGITGSNQFLGEWKIDPITHTYDDLVDSLKTNGYIEGQNLFYFPYDWRKNNATTAHYLQSKIESVIVETKTSKVDVVAHSMGGLVARAYIEEIEGCDYENTIDQLITLGTPQKGSPEAYLKWEAGEGFFSMNENLAKHHFKQEAEEEGYDDLQKYIREKVVSVGELLPEYDYLFDISDDKIRNYPNNYPANNFLEELNRIGNVEKLEKINHINIIGKLENTSSTISKIRVVDSAVSGKWENGMPENFYDDSTSRGLEFGEGDETVPLESAKGIIADKNIELNSTHSELPTKAQCEIFRELTGKQECDYDEDIHFVNILLFNVFSPVDLQITAPDGNRIGKDFATGEILNEIENAYYTGYDTKNEFITIPNPIDGEYQIKTQGTGSGDYRIEVAKIFEDENNSQQALESTAIINGIAEEGKTEEIQIEVSQDQVSQKKAITLESIVSEIDRYQKSGMISKNEAKNLQRSLRRIISLDKLSEEIENNKKIKEENKQKLQKLIAERRLKYLDALIKYIGNKPDKLISQQAKTFLIESLEYVKTRLLIN